MTAGWVNKPIFVVQKLHKEDLGRKLRAHRVKLYDRLGDKPCKGVKIGLLEGHRCLRKPKQRICGVKNISAATLTILKMKSKTARELVYAIQPSDMGPFHIPCMLQHPKLLAQKYFSLSRKLELQVTVTKHPGVQNKTGLFRG